MLAACLAGAGFLARSIASQRSTLQLAVSMEGTAGMPPHVALATAALGTFRGLAVDMLWARADALQDKGDYFEAQTLSQWITALQPRFPKVWSFQAWNLAYNISVTTYVPEERWRWINRGIDLLRSQGMPLNPQDASLPMELGWLFFHKIGGKVDREHWYYKARLAREFRELLGDLTGGRTASEAVDRFRVIADASLELDAADGDADLRDALRLLEEHDAKPDEELVRMLGRATLYMNSLDAKIRLGGGLPTGTNRDLLAAMRADRRLAAAIFEKVVPHVQRRVLLDRYSMDARIMLELMEQYGPLDWAHPHAQGVYWLERGIALSQATKRRERINELTIVKTRLASLRQLTRSGRIEYDPLTDRLDILPDPRFIEAYERGMQQAMLLTRSAAGLSAGDFGMASVEDLLKGYSTFLQEATVFSYLYGDEDLAAGCFSKLRTMAEEAGTAEQPMYSEGLQGFLILRMGEVMQVDVSNTRQFIDAMIQRAMLEGLAKGRIDTFNRFMKLAFNVYDRRYGATVPDAKYVSKEARLPPFPEIVDASFESAMRQSGNPLLVRARIWAWAPEQVKTRVWSRLAEPLAEQCRIAGLDPDRAFPKPGGTGPAGRDGNESRRDTPDEDVPVERSRLDAA
ncbi:MAG: hypothetical protein EBZ74_06225 [Planctomycetia bacterium]|nr:hypothetical protein [Planctomycetia bacterium]